MLEVFPTLEGEFLRGCLACCGLVLFWILCNPEFCYVEEETQEVRRGLGCAKLKRQAQITGQGRAHKLVLSNLVLWKVLLWAAL